MANRWASRASPRPHRKSQDGLPLLGARHVTLADGATVSLDVYRTTVLWEGAERPVRAFASQGTRRTTLTCCAVARTRDGCQTYVR
jgi:predicted aspartyl protease